MVDTSLRINDVIEITGISRRAVYNAMNSGKLAFKKLLLMDIMLEYLLSMLFCRLFLAYPR